MDMKQARRFALNEARYRDMNDRVTAAVKRFRNGVGGDRFAVMCECPVSECTQMIELSFAEYRHVRTDGRWFVVWPEHLISAVEDPVERHDTYWIIEKQVSCGEIA